VKDVAFQVDQHLQSTAAVDREQRVARCHPQYLNLSFDERLGLLVDREAETRDSRRLALRLKAAKLRQEATRGRTRLPSAQRAGCILRLVGQDVARKPGAGRGSDQRRRDG
jgi:hypothetical protein